MPPLGLDPDTSFISSQILTQQVIVLYQSYSQSFRLKAEFQELKKESYTQGTLVYILFDSVQVCSYSVGRFHN